MNFPFHFWEVLNLWLALRHKKDWKNPEFHVLWNLPRWWEVKMRRFHVGCNEKVPSSTNLIMSSRLDQVTSGGPFQPELFSDSASLWGFSSRRRLRIMKPNWKRGPSHNQQRPVSSRKQRVCNATFFPYCVYHLLKELTVLSIGVCSSHSWKTNLPGII